eukprot:6361006-Prymnesium_polylepis.1
MAPAARSAPETASPTRSSPVGSSLAAGSRRSPLGSRSDTYESALQLAAPPRDDRRSTTAPDPAASADRCWPP